MLFIFGFYAALFITASADQAHPATFRDGDPQQRIAIIPVTGTIDGETSTFIRRCVDAVLEDPTIQAVVLRVESPGGGATASDEILHELARLKTDRNLPLVASYGDYATSGGYFVSCQSDRIFAQPTTITGSIGVIAPFFTVHQLLSKLGVEPKIMTSTDATSKDTASMFRPWNEADEKQVRKLLDSVQNRFVEVVATGRTAHLTPEQVRTLADGGIFTASEALERKLIDEIGYLDSAIDHARKSANIVHPRPQVVIYRAGGGLMGIVGAHSSLSPTAAVDALFNLEAAKLTQTAAELTIPRVMLMP
jgi:protease-4